MPKPQHMLTRLLLIFSAGLFALGSFAPTSVTAQQTESSSCPVGDPVELRDCYDGDTCSFYGIRKRARFARIDTPELDGECEKKARKAKKAVTQLLRESSEICVKIKGKGFFGRPLGEVYVEGKNLNDWLLEKELAREYGKETCPKAAANSTKNDDAGSTAEVDCSTDYTCGEIDTCERARAIHKNCDAGLDGDGDGTPCEALCDP